MKKYNILIPSLLIVVLTIGMDSINKTNPRSNDANANVCTEASFLSKLLPIANANPCNDIPGWSRVYIQGEPDHPVNCTYTGIGCIVCENPSDPGEG